MQEGHNKLKEIIWEITSECHNGCSYCGSKDSCTQKTDTNIINKVLCRIMEYPPEEINISGGDPLCVNFATHQLIIKSLHERDVVCKIIVNPKSFKQTGNEQECHRILELYDHIGMSINTGSEFDIFLDNIEPSELEKTTIITNFNVGNVFMFEKIEEIVLQHDLIWQIQYTMFKEDNDLALYKNDEARKYLFDKIGDSVAKIILADNMNEGSCGAGQHGLGILSSGYVVPCLSMRSWTDIKYVYEGDLMDETLEDIWIHRFTTSRFGDFKCCKDHVGNCPYKSEPKLNNFFPNVKEWINPEDYQKPPVIPNNPRVALYGVTTPNTYVYAVFNNKDYFTSSTSVDE